jgi:hypothetical protein
MFKTKKDKVINQFQDKNSLLELYRTSRLSKTYKEDLLTLEDRQLFWSLVIRTGDIERTHNIMRKNDITSSGDGLAKRYEFHDLLSQLSKDHYPMLVRLMDIIREYTNFENLLYPKLKTDRKNGKLTIARKPIFEIKDIVNYLSTNWEKWSYTEKQMIVKFMPAIPRSRKGKQSFTIVRDKWNYDLITAFCKAFNMSTKDYTKLRSEGIRSTEAVKFSVSKDHKESIFNMTKNDFEKWLEILPAGQRQRMYSRLIQNPEKWKTVEGYTVLSLYKAVEQAKADAAETVRKLEAKVVTRGVSVSSLSATEQLELDEARKKAKVNVGANSITDIYNMYIIKKISREEANNMFHNIISKWESNINCLPIIDVSSSMTGNPSTTAALYATAFMIKNLTELFVTFTSNVQVITPGVTICHNYQYWKTTQSSVKIDSFINIEEDFLTNFERVNAITECFHGGGTDFTNVSDLIFSYFKKTGLNLGEKYPVFVIFSDGAFNSDNGGLTNAEKVLNSARAKLASIGWDGYFVIWDIHSLSSDSTTMTNCRNTIRINSTNGTTIDKLMTGVLDMHYVDGYAPLLTVFNDDRYRLIRERVL